jgi:AcrR family transcriptional regulator
MMAAEPLTREQILTAAKEALRRYGPAKTTVIDVAQSLGVSHGAVYRHFPTKAALRAAVVQEGLEGIAGKLGAIASEPGPAVDRLHRWLLTLIEFKQDFCRTDPELFATYGMIASDGPEVVREHVDVLTSQIGRILEDGAATGEIHPIVLDKAGAMAVWDATSRFHNPANRGEWASPHILEDFERVWALIVHGLAA